jgi:hypothetical protein
VIRHPERAPSVRSRSVPIVGNRQSCGIYDGADAANALRNALLRQDAGGIRYIDVAMLNFCADT